MSSSRVRNSAIWSSGDVWSSRLAGSPTAPAATDGAARAAKLIAEPL